MVKIKLKNGSEIYLDGYLKAQLDSLAWNAQHDWDFVIIVTGDRMVRTGKSVLAMSICCYLAELLGTPFSLDNVFFSSQEMVDAALQMPKNSVVQYDEARESLASSKYMYALQQDIMDFFAECGQLNHIFVLVLPDFFGLKEEMAVGRSECLINVYRTPVKTSSGGLPIVKFSRGRFEFFNRKKKAILFDKAKSTRQKNYGLVKCDFVGSFTDNYPLGEVEYKKKKAEALGRFKEKKEKEKAKPNLRYIEHLRVCLWLLKKKEVSVKELCDYFDQFCQEPFTDRSISRFIKSFLDRQGDTI